MTAHKPTIAESMHEVLEGMTGLLDAVDGYRAQCSQRGYSETAAEVMAMDFHRALVAAAFGAKKQ